MGAVNGYAHHHIIKIFSDTSQGPPKHRLTITEQAASVLETSYNMLITGVAKDAGYAV